MSWDRRWILACKHCLEANILDSNQGIPCPLLLILSFPSLFVCMYMFTEFRGFDYVLLRPNCEILFGIEL